MDILFVVVVLAVLGLPIALGLARATEVFSLRFERGQLRFARGRMPSALLGEIEAVMTRARASGRITVRRSRGSAAVTLDGEIDAGTQQQLRNVIGIVPLQRLLSSPPVRRRRQH